MPEAEKVNSDKRDDGVTTVADRAQRAGAQVKAGTEGRRSGLAPERSSLRRRAPFLRSYGRPRQRP